ncbi:MAG: hypothetical protein LBS86_04030 [Treponema sp.]|jgi:hypothetical protein|nr:hypothetical protein [Treponema sp.]
MTLSKRNFFFKAGIGLSAVFCALTLVCAAIVLPLFPAVVSDVTRRVDGVFQGIIVRFFESRPYAPFFSILCAVLYAFVTIILIYRYFEKTRCLEILFFGFFVFSFAFEACRVMAPLSLKYAFPGLYLTMASRCVLFGRYLGLFSLFAASVCASGLELEKQRSVIWVIILITLAIAVGTPIDSLAWDSSLCMIRAYPTMFSTIEACLSIGILLSFFIASYTRRSSEYFFVGIGTALALLGRNLLYTTDTWLSPVPALLALIAGTWLVCTHLHRVYLWL